MIRTTKAESRVMLNTGIDLQFFLSSWKQSMLAAVTMLFLPAEDSRADDLRVETRILPPLRIESRLASAHTQGLEVTQGRYYVTARRDDVLPKRALLLRTDERGTNWDFWDITPVDGSGTLTALDHPGGMQSDGQRLWIPLAESKREGRSVIRAFPMAGMIPGQPLKAELEFPVNDHIGAVAVDKHRRIVYGANWDTESVYVWDFDGRLQRTVSGPGLESRALGVVGGANGRAGLAVQDWKVVGDRLFASGLFRGPGVVPEVPQSRLMSFSGFLTPEFQRWSIILSTQNGTELAREAMAVSDGTAHFLPEDLGASNRIFRVSLADLMKRSAPHAVRSSP